MVISIKKMAMIIIGVLFGFFIGAVMVIVMAISSGDTMKELMCPLGSCFEAPIDD